MTTTIVGLFDHEQSALELERAIIDHGIDHDQVETLTWRSLSEGNDPWGIGEARSRGEQPSQHLIDHLTDHGVPESDARDFAEAVRRGGNLVLTEVDDDEVDEISRLMDQEEAVDLEERRALWAQEEHADLEPSGDLYTPEEVDTERQRTLGVGDEARIQTAKEEMRVGKREVLGKGVRIHKHVEEKPVKEDIKLREEHIDIERKKVDKPITSEEPFKEETIELTEHGEEPVVEKKARVEEEIVAGVHAEERTETVEDTLRETVVDIENINQGLESERKYASFEPDFREHYNNNYAARGGSYSDYEPAYRYGHAFGSEKRYRDRDYDMVEPDLRRSYESKYGEGSFEDYSDAARYGFESARSRRSERL